MSKSRSASQLNVQATHKIIPVHKWQTEAVSAKDWQNYECLEHIGHAVDSGKMSYVAGLVGVV